MVDAETGDNTVELAEGETRPLLVQLYPDNPGRMALAVVATDTESGEPTVSDLVGLTATSNRQDLWMKIL